MKVCPKCNQDKDVNEFAKNKSTKDGLQAYCKACRKETRSTPEERAKAAANKKCWKKRNPDKVRKAKLKYQQTHKAEAYAAQLRWKREHPEMTRAGYRRHYARHPEKHAVKRLKRRALLANAPGSFTEEEWLAKFELYDRGCAYCGSKEKIHKHHVQALSRGGSNSIENLVPACAACNLQIGTKLVMPPSPVKQNDGKDTSTCSEQPVH